MKIYWPLGAVVGFVSVCLAQTYNISGIVTDTGTTPLSGAVVKLEKAGLTATSGADGRFTLKSTGVFGKAGGLIVQRPAVTLQGGRLSLDLQEPAVVRVRVYSVQGRLLSTVQRTMVAGLQSMLLQQAGTGVYLYSVKIGSQEVFLKGNAVGGGSGSSGVIMTNRAAKQVGNAAAINDVIAVTKDGYLNYRCVQYNSDTSGVVIKMIANAGDMADADGNVYQTVRIGNQVWMAENLRTTKYNDGTPIPHVTDSAAWRRIYDSSLTTPAYCFYKNTTNSDSLRKYGALYNWYVVNPANLKKLAPTGWHVPTEAEWDTLQNCLIAKGYNWDGTTTGNKIAKALAAKTDWKTYTPAGTIGCDLTMNNRCGFSALPGGYRGSSGSFYGQSEYVVWWSATESNASNAWYRYLYYDIDYLFRLNYYKSCGFSLRLVKDH